MDELAELQAQHAAGHGPCGCLQSDRCASARYLAVIERLIQDHADYAEHTAASHRVMVDEVDRLERVATAARKLTVGRLAYVAAWDAESVTDSGNYLADWEALCSALALLAAAP